MGEVEARMVGGWLCKRATYLGGAESGQGRGDGEVGMLGVGKHGTRGLDGVGVGCLGWGSCGM